MEVRELYMIRSTRTEACLLERLLKSGTQEPLSRATARSGSKQYATFYAFSPQDVADVSMAMHVSFAVISRNAE